MRYTPSFLLAAAAALAMSASATAADAPQTFKECVDEQTTNLNVDCVGAAQVGPKPRKAKPTTPRKVRVQWSLGACAGDPVTSREWHVRIQRDDTRGSHIPAEAADGTRRFLFSGTSQAGTQDIKLPRGAYYVELAIDHAITADGGDCGPIDVVSQRFVVR